MPAALRCLACGNTYADRWRCECGHPLEFADRPLHDDPAPKTHDTHDGLWTFANFLPIERRVTLGEGWTPLLDARNWNATFKLEYVSPTGSFKDRGAAMVVSRALELGVERLIEDSSGNAGAAMATYAARAGLDATIYVPADAKASKLRAIERAGADIVRITGNRDDVARTAVDTVEDGEGWYASHAWNPAFFAGTETFAFEVAAEYDWQVPDAIVCPVGHGTLFLGAYRGFRALFEEGWVEEMPRLLGAQAAGYAPIVRQRDDSAGHNDLADGIRIRNPVRADQIIKAIEATDGDAIAVGEQATKRELDRLHRAGFYVEPTCAVAPVALGEYRERGVLEEDADVVVPLTGSGMKT